jgi:hypothetical protein
MVSKDIIDSYVKNFKKKGEFLFFEYIFKLGISNIQKIPNIDTEFLDIAEYFFSLYRTTGNNNYFLIGRCFRRAAHRLNRFLIKNHKKEKNLRFLRLIK